MRQFPPALLALEDGTLWSGVGFGAIGDTTGEMVFNTSMTGYQEILTDPSYHGQIVAMTTPHIGNYGVNPEDNESSQIWSAGFVVRSLSPVVSNWRAQQSLPDYLQENGIVGITDVATRALVQHIRTYGAMRAAISSSNPDPQRLVALAKASRDMNGLDLAREVTCGESYHWNEAQDWWKPNSENSELQEKSKKQITLVKNQKTFHVVAYDFGIKRNILRLLANHGCRVTVVPAETSAEEVLNLNPDGIFLSNGPGDPTAVSYAIESVKQLLGKKPLFGICLGHQILSLALGAKTYKLKFGHRGGNQPVQVTTSGAVQISSHNHGFAVDSSTLPIGVTMSHVNLNDQCCEGLNAPDYNAFSVQYHPESSPGPHDSDELFDKFISMMVAA
jgi:carbamoyl-phosphate synthase small subunit